MSVHGVRKPYESFESIRMQVFFPSHRSHDRCEDLEVVILHEQRMLFKERDDPFLEIVEPGDRLGHDRALRTLVIDVPAPEIGAETLQQLTLVRVLGHLERGSELPPPRASGVSRIGVDGH